jgi:hypothetical protein
LVIETFFGKVFFAASVFISQSFLAVVEPAETLLPK